MMTVSRFEWERAVRALPIKPPTAKLVALMLSTYADKGGANAHPGEDRLAEDCGISTRQVRKYLALLVDLGLLDKVFSGSSAGRRRLADEYALVLAGDVLASVKHRNSASGAPQSDEDKNSGTPVQEQRNSAAEQRNSSAGTAEAQFRPPDHAPRTPTNSSPSRGRLPAQVPTAREGSARHSDHNEAKATRCVDHEAMTIPCKVCRSLGRPEWRSA